MANSDSRDPSEPGRIEPFGRFESMKVIVPLLESLLEDHIDDVSMPMRAQLVLMMRWPELPQAVCLQTAFGRRVGEKNLEWTQRVMTQAERRGVSIDGRIADLQDAGTVPSDGLAQLFRGETTRRPDEQRLDRGILLLQASADAAPHELHQPMLCAIGWMLWAKGRPDDAMTFLMHASGIDPTEPLTRGLIRHFSSANPQWLSA